MPSKLLLTSKPDGTDAPAQIGDAIAFLGYFGACLVVGGVAHNNAYNNVFKFEALPTNDLLQSAIDFCVQVLWNDGYAWLAVPFFASFAYLFYAARFVLQRWAGYSLLCTFLLVSFTGCLLLGNAKGKDEGQKDSLVGTSLPAIKLYLDVTNIDKAEGAPFDSGRYHLLASDSDRIIVFEPPETEGSNTIVTAVKRSDVHRYRVTLK